MPTGLVRRLPSMPLSTPNYDPATVAAPNLEVKLNDDFEIQEWKNFVQECRFAIETLLYTLDEVHTEGSVEVLDHADF